MPVKSAPDVAPEYPFEEQWALAQARYSGTIRTFARNFDKQIPHMDREDIEQELLVVLWKTVKGYDPTRGAGFNTLFQGNCKNRCISLVRTANTAGRKGITQSLSDEAVERAVNDVFDRQCMPSTEDRVMDRLEIQEYVSIHGTDCLVETKRGRKPLRRVS